MRLSILRVDNSSSLQSLSRWWYLSLRLRRRHLARSFTSNWVSIWSDANSIIVFMLISADQKEKGSRVKRVWCLTCIPEGRGDKMLPKVPARKPISRLRPDSTFSFNNSWISTLVWINTHTAMNPPNPYFLYFCSISIYSYFECKYTIFSPSQATFGKLFSDATNW